MALWHVSTLPDGCKTVVYQNVMTSATWCCGVSSPDTTDEDLLAWCVDDGSAEAGDIIVVHERRVFYLGRWRGQA